ncbi:MAG: hypothetical protein LBE01_02985, partial [Deltaproteobacteria bacterium]|nr:hypothetical protein [Deltaproteobacteria bacterium]
MTTAFDDQKPGPKRPGQSGEWALDNPQAQELARYKAGEKLDVPKLMTVAREFAKALAVFRPPEGYRPEPAVPEPTLTVSMARALGTTTLTEYFLKTLNMDPPAAQLARRREPPLPRGPESVAGAILAVDEAIDANKSSDPVLYKKVIGELSAIRASLARAQTLGKELESLAERWRPESLWKIHQAKKLDEAARLLAMGPESELEATPPALTNLTQALLERLSESRAVLEGHKRWRMAARLFLEDMDGLKAALSTGSGQTVDLAGRLKTLTGRLGDLEAKSQDLADRRSETDQRLAAALAELEKAETRLTGEKRASSLKMGEALAASVESLWRSVVARRTELAKVWLALPPLVGRPIFLDRIFLYAAINLGRAQSLLEELKSRLASQAGRLSSSRGLRLAARETLALSRDKAYPNFRRRAGRLVDELKAILKKRTQEREKSQVDES